MAVVPWSDLPTDIILLIAEVLSSDVDTIRLRSVCSHWRSSVRRRYRPLSFPLEVPPLLSKHSHALRKGMRYFLRCQTFCRLSPPDFGPYSGDPSDGYMLRVSEHGPNTFSLPSLLRLHVPTSDPTLVPKQVNLLDFRVTEICKCYNVTCLNSGPNEEFKRYLITKVIVLWNYDVDCEFAVLVLIRQGFLLCWKFGDEDWFAINSGNHNLNDVVLYDGKCYAITGQGVLVFLDSKFNLILAPSLPHLPVDLNEGVRFYLMEYKSELFVMSTYYDKDKAKPNSISQEEIPLEVNIFKKKSSTWEHVKCLGDDLFIFCMDVAVGLSVKEFSGCKGNCVYLSPDQLFPYGLDNDSNEVEYGVYDMDKGRTLIRKWGKARTIICRPPPNWLLSG